MKCFMENKNKQISGAKPGSDPPAKCWFKGFILLHTYHAPNYYQTFSHTLTN